MSPLPRDPRGFYHLCAFRVPYGLHFGSKHKEKQCVMRKERRGAQPGAGSGGRGSGAFRPATPQQAQCLRPQPPPLAAAWDLPRVAPQPKWTLSRPVD